MYGNSYSTLFFDPYNPGISSDPSEPTADITVEQFLELPGEDRQLFYDLVSGLLVADDGDVHVDESMLSMLAYGVMHEEREYKPAIADGASFKEWMGNVRDTNPELLSQFNNVVQSDYQEYIRDPEVQREMVIKAGASLLGATVIGGTAPVVLGATAAAPSALVGTATAGSAFVQSSAILSAISGITSKMAAASFGLAFVRLADRMGNPEEVKAQEAGVVAEARAERLAAWESLDEAGQQQLIDQGISTVSSMLRVPGLFAEAGQTEAEREVTEIDKRMDEVEEQLTARSDTGQIRTWDDTLRARMQAGQLTFGSPTKPIPWASAPEYDSSSFGVPGTYKVSAGRQTYLTSQMMQAEMRAAKERLEAVAGGDYPGLSPELIDAGYEEGQLPAYIAPQTDRIPQESYYFVPADYTAQWTDNFGNTVWREPRYKESDNDAFFSMRTFSPEYLAIFQDQMVDAGLLRKGNYLPGMKDQPTLNALKVTMGQANVTGEWYKSVAGQMAEAGRSWGSGGGGGYVRPPFVKRTYIKPDYEEMSYAAKETFRQGLGRDPHDWEMKMLADKLGSEHQRQFDVVEEARWKDYQRGTGGNKLTSETIEGIENPADVMMNYFDRQWAPELERQERKEAQRVGARSFFNSMTQTDNRVFSGRSEAMTQKVGN